jgi:general secretion pathway protein I
MVLIGIVLPIAMQGISLCLSVASNARRSVEAASLAESKLADLLTTNQWQMGSLSGDFGEDWPDYTWVAEPIQRDVDLYELTLRVKWQARNEEREVALTTLVYLGGQTQ